MRTLIAVFVLLIATPLFAQENRPYQHDIDIIRAFDNIYPTAPNPIVFVGSSSIRMWASLQTSFGNYNVINRGIGGAVINEIIANLDELVFKYEPRQIVVYVGENDLPNENITADTVLTRTRNLFSAIRQKLPTIPIVYIAMKPSPSRDKFMPKAMAANKLVKDFIATQKDCVFADIYTPMLSKGKSRPELFIEDMLHMNEQGYAIWVKVIKKHLIKPLR